jgi:uncharacterized membrane protein YfcA
MAGIGGGGGIGAVPLLLLAEEEKIEVHNAFGSGTVRTGRSVARGPTYGSLSSLSLGSGG